MRKTLTLAAAATVLTASLAGCSSSDSRSSNGAPADAASPKVTAAQAKPLTAQIAFAKLSAAVSTTKLSGTPGPT
ncbi:hypothetical protein AB5J52_38560 [Streptomyces sp. R39]|uniref:Fasciclin domain-containing protein n=1 Tax=Streptomyces sp. R39 TaxID=3238631 RepID=A0AB39QZP9_9ACTN